VENFKTKVRQITTRSHNLDSEVIVKLNRVIRGTANYFATPWSHCGDMYRTLDTHETAMHETQTKIDGGSLSIPFEASQAYGLTLPERPANPKCSRIVTFS